MAHKYFGGKNEDYKVKTTKCQQQDTAKNNILAIPNCHPKLPLQMDPESINLKGHAILLLIPPQCKE